MNDLLLTTISTVEADLNEDKMDKINITISEYNPKMEAMIKEFSSIINGLDITTQQNVIDDFFKDENLDNMDSSSAQDDIDSLFD
jgi:hypothetical protein